MNASESGSRRGILSAASLFVFGLAAGALTARPLYFLFSWFIRPRVEGELESQLLLLIWASVSGVVAVATWFIGLENQSRACARFRTVGLWMLVLIALAWVISAAPLGFWWFVRWAGEGKRPG